MSQIVKESDGYGIQVPVLAGLSSTKPEDGHLLKGQLCLADSNNNSTASDVSLYIGDGNGNAKLVNKMFPFSKGNVSIPLTGNSTVGGFTVNADNLDGGEGSVSKKIKNFTADQVKVILESDSYDTSLPSSGVEGQLFLLVQA